VAKSCAKVAARATDSNPNKEAMAGAAACLKALQAAQETERRGFNDPETCDYSVERYFRDRDRIKAAFIKSAGITPSSFQAGFIATLAEYIHLSLSTGEPEVSAWKPETLMSENEVQVNREEAIRFCAEDEACVNATGGAQ
jgi:hypothetical protein